MRRVGTEFALYENNLQKTRQWVNDLAEELGRPGDQHYAFRILRSFLHALRDRLPVDETAQLALAEVSLQFGAAQVRAQAATEHKMGAIDLLVDRLQRRRVQHQNRVRSRHRWLAEGSQHEWRHGDLPSRRLEHFPRPPHDREVVRRKTFAVDPMTADEAAFDMDLLGHDFYLFADLDSGKDAVIYRTSEGRYAILGDVSPRDETAAVVEYGGRAARLDEHQAKAHLDIAAEPFVFYIDRDSGRGRVLYLRYDGHYGLIAAD